MSVLSYQDLKALIYGKVPAILSNKRIKATQIQMASVDCTLGSVAYRMKASALPSRGEAVEDLIKKFSLYKFKVKPDGSPLEVGACYIVKLNERFNLPKEFQAVFSPKSSIGRVDVFVRVLCDGSDQYDKTPFGYKGSLYLEIIPLSFGVKITPELEMIQFRIKDKGTKPLTNEELVVLHSKSGLVYEKDGTIIPFIDTADDSLFFHIDLEREIVGWKAKTTSAKFINLSQKDYYEVADFWIPIYKPADGSLILEPGKFYLLPTQERVKIPSEYCAEMVAYDISSGEFRSHYAGFFDNGFGGEKGTTAVLEVRARDVAHRLVNGQRICRMFFEKTTQIPSKLYGHNSQSHYIGSGPSLPKNFKDRAELWKE